MNLDCLGFVHDIPIIESAWLMDWKTVDRSWGERLFSKPWRPWRRAKEISTPSRRIIQFGVPPTRLIMHPEMAAEVRRAVAERTT